MWTNYCRQNVINSPTLQFIQSKFHTKRTEFWSKSNDGIPNTLFQLHGRDSPVSSNHKNNHQSNSIPRSSFIRGSGSSHRCHFDSSSQSSRIRICWNTRINLFSTFVLESNPVFSFAMRKKRPWKVVSFFSLTSDHPNSTFVITFDLFDGSITIDVNVTVGSIVGLLPFNKLEAVMNDRPEQGNSSPETKRRKPTNSNPKTKRLVLLYDDY